MTSTRSHRLDRAGACSGGRRLQGRERFGDQFRRFGITHFAVGAAENNHDDAPPASRCRDCNGKSGPTKETGFEAVASLDPGHQVIVRAHEDGPPVRTEWPLPS